jgi:hypothetical protein
METNQFNKIKTTTLLFFLLVIGANCSAQTLNWNWAKSAGGINGQAFTKVETDASGNIYTAGVYSFSGITIDTTVITDHASISPNSDLVLAKYDAGGNLIWTKVPVGIDTLNGSTVYQMSVDKTGNIYVQGAFSAKNSNSALVFDQDTIKASNGGGGYEFLVKFDPMGNTQWTKILYKHGYSFAFSRSMINDNSGNVLLLGMFGVGDSLMVIDTTHIRNIHYPSAGPAEMWLICFDPNGNVLWHTQAGGKFNDMPQDIDVAENGDLYVSGVFSSDTMYFGSSYLLNTNPQGGILYPQDLFYARYDSVGNFKWAKKVPVNYLSGGSAASCTIDTAGDYFLCFSFKLPSLTIDSVTLSPSGHYIIKIDTTGLVQSGQIIGDTGIASFQRDLRSDAMGNLYVLGSFAEDSIWMGNKMLYNTNPETATLDAFMVKLNYRNSIIWSTSFGSNDRDDPVFTVTPTGTIVTAGAFRGDNIAFGPLNVFNSDYPNTDIFLASTDGLVGINDLNFNNEIFLYPNPAGEQINIRFNESLNSKITLSVVNLLGETVIQNHYSNLSEATIDISQLKSGMYILQIRNEKGMLSKKFVKQ